MMDKIKKYILARGLYWFARVSMSIGFILSGFRKMPGLKFTILTEDNPVGLYFKAMYETGFYWNFIGFLQMILGLMLIFDRTVVFASLIMMSVTLNIFLVSISLNMKGTPYITSLMLLANILLIVWHFDHYKSIFQKPVSITK